VLTVPLPADEQRNCVHRQETDDPTWFITKLAQGFLRAVGPLVALELSRRSRRPCLPQPQPRRRGGRSPRFRRWQMIFPALPRPGPRTARAHFRPYPLGVIA
jgi:hypothetical protein